jgi:aspartate racemase
VKDSNNKIAGVLGGMGPDATVDFMAKVIARTAADKDQDHVRMIVDHNPKVPDRKHAMLGSGEDPGPILAAMAAGLETAGADFLVMPCNTAHAFSESIREAVGIPLVSIIDLTVAACTGLEAVGVLATNTCLQCEIYQKALAAENINSVIPDDGELAELMRLITAIKTGDRGEVVSEGMRRVAEAQVEKGAEAIVAGCTEIPLVLINSMLDVALISSTDVLAEATVKIARGEIQVR